MGPFAKIKGFIKETWACLNEGGSPITDVWKQDVELRAAVQKFGGTDADIEGGLFLDDLKEFYAAIDTFNATRSEDMRFKLMVHEKIADGLAAEATGEKKTMLGYSAVGPLALERNGRIYQGRYFSDMVYNSGFAFSCQGVEAKFLCGLQEKTDFGSFVSRMLNPAPAYPHPVIPRIS